MVTRRFLTGLLLGAPLALTVAAAVVVTSVLPGVFDGSSLRGQAGGGWSSCTPQVTDFKFVGAKEIIAGSDGNLWVTLPGSHSIGRLPLPSGSVSEFPLASYIYPESIAESADGNFWFTYGTFPNSIGRITPSGTVTYFPIPTAGAGASAIASGPDGNLWVAEVVGGKIARVTPGGAMTEFPSGFSRIYGIASGPDGNVWFVGQASQYVFQIARITRTGEVTKFPVPAGAVPSRIAAGPDGNLWITDIYHHEILKMTTAGEITQYALSEGSKPVGITVGPDGNLWFTETGIRKIGRITTAGIVTEYAHPSLRSDMSLYDITAGPDGNLYFTDTQGSAIGMVTCSGAASSAAFSGASSAQSDSASSAQSVSASSVVSSDGSSSSSATSGSSSSVSSQSGGDICTPICGDGLKIGPEECDDKNTKNGDGCSSTCRREAAGSSSSSRSSSRSSSARSSSASSPRCPADVCSRGGTAWCAGLPGAPKTCVFDETKNICFDCRIASSSSSSSSAPRCPANACNAQAKAVCSAQGRQCVTDSSAASCFRCDGEYVCQGNECGRGGKEYCDALGGKSCVATSESQICIDCKPRCPADPCGGGGEAYCAKYGKTCAADPLSAACIDCQPEPPVQCTGTAFECENGGKAYCAGFGKICAPSPDGICIQCLGQGECTGTGYECANGGQEYCSAVGGGICSPKADGICIQCSDPGPYTCQGNECRKGGASYCATLGQGCKNVPDGICIDCMATGCTSNLECAEGAQCVAGKCAQLCGNGRLDPGEACDPSSGLGAGLGTGCTPECLLAENQECRHDTDCASVACRKGVCVPCTTGGQCQSDQCREGTCENLCGNGTVDLGEICDPGLDGASADCTRDCLRPAGKTCVESQECQTGLCRGDGRASVCVPCGNNGQCGAGLCVSGACIDECGDGTVDAFEQCDDGNKITGDGCDRFCRRETTVAGEVLPISLLGDVTPGATVQPIEEGRRAEDVRAIAGSHAAAGETGPAAVIAIAGGAAAGWSYMRRRRGK